MARTPTEAVAPGVWQEAFEKIYVESEYATLRACLLASRAAGRDPKVKSQQDNLAEAYRNNGIEVVRQQVSCSADIAGGQPGKVLGNLLIQAHPPRSDPGQREALNELFKHDERLVWLNTPAPVCDAGDFRVFPMHLVFGIGVTDPSHIEDRSKARSSGDELIAEAMRRMIEPFDWNFSIVYFDCTLSQHLGDGLALIDEGLLATPKGFLWTSLPDEFRGWEVIEVSWDEHAMGATNLVPLGDRKVLLEARARKLARELAQRGYVHVPVEFGDVFSLGGGLQRSTMPLWRENLSRAPNQEKNR